MTTLHWLAVFLVLVLSAPATLREDVQLPTRIQSHQDEAARLFETRVGHYILLGDTGHIFRDAVAIWFRGMTAEAMHNASFRAWLQMRDEYPRLRAEVNKAYPLLAEHDVPLTLLRILPDLPKHIYYRVVGYDLVLWDEQENVVIDVLRDAFSTVTIND